MAHVLSRVIEICVFKIVHHDPLYLLLRRSDTETPYPGIWQIVSGMVEGEEHSVRAALRELHEETSLRPERLWVAPYVDVFYSAANDTVNLSPLFAAQVAESVEPKLSSEHQTYGWNGYDEAKSLLVWPGQKKGLKRVHKYIVGGLESGQLTEIKNFSLFERSDR